MARFTLTSAKEVADNIIKEFDSGMFNYRLDIENLDVGYAKAVGFTYNPLNRSVTVEYGKLTYRGYVNDNGETVRWSRFQFFFPAGF